MNNLSEKEKIQERIFLQEYSPSLQDAYERISKLLWKNGMGKRVKNTCVFFRFCDKELRRNGTRHHVTIYFEDGFLKFFVRHDDYRFCRDGKDLPNIASRKNKLRGRLGYHVDIDRTQKHFYVAVPNTDHVDELIAYIERIFP